MRRPGETVRGIFRPDGEFWTIAFRGSSFHLRGSVGLAWIARLLARPDQEVHVVELAATPGPATSGPRAGGDADLPRTRDLGHAGTMLDARPRQAYRRRLQELDETLADAEARGDDVAALRAREEIEALADQMASAVGLGGRDRVAAAHTERARVRVTKAIRAAVGKIREHDPALADHLERSLRTGTYSVYRPDPAFSIAWDLETPAGGVTS